MTQDPNMPPGQPPVPGAPMGGPPDAYAGPPPTKDEQTMAMICHITCIFGLLCWVGPLIFYSTRKDSPFILDQSRQALNWALTVIIGFIAPVLVFWCPPVAILVFFGVAITNLVICIMAALKANQGIAHRYPFSIKFVKA